MITEQQQFTWSKFSFAWWTIMQITRRRLFHGTLLEAAQDHCSGIVPLSRTKVDPPSLCRTIPQGTLCCMLNPGGCSNGWMMVVTSAWVMKQRIRSARRRPCWQTIIMPGVVYGCPVCVKRSHLIGGRKVLQSHALFSSHEEEEAKDVSWQTTRMAAIC